MHIDNPPVNAPAARSVRNCRPSSPACADDAAIDAIVVWRRQDVCRRADIKELEQAAWSTAEPRTCHDLLRLVEEAPKPMSWRYTAPHLAAGWNLPWPATIGSRFRTLGWVNQRSSRNHSRGRRDAAVTRLVGVEKAHRDVRVRQAIARGRARVGLIDQ